MNRLIKLIYINILSFLDINKINTAKEKELKSGSEIKLIGFIIILLAIGTMLYNTYNYFLKSLNSKMYVFDLAFILATIFSLVLNIILVKTTLFANEDNDLLFSLPLTKEQIVFSRLSNLYLKNIIFTLTIIGSSLLAYNNFNKVDENLFLICLLTALIIPLIPIIIINLLSIINNYLKTNKKLNTILKMILTIVLLIILLSIPKLNITNNSKILLKNYKTITYIYPLLFLFHYTIQKNSIITLIILLIIPILLTYLFRKYLSYNYLQICSSLKSIKLNKTFTLKNRINLHKTLGYLRKERINLLTNKEYFKSSYSLTITLSTTLLIISLIIPKEYFLKIPNFTKYFNLYSSLIISSLISFNASTISSFSIEKDNIQILKTLPIKINKIIFIKWLIDIIASTLFILINGTIINFYFKPNLFIKIFNYLLPLIIIMMNRLLFLTLDYRFISKNFNDSYILKQRIITIIPYFLSLLFLLIPSILPVYTKYKEVILTFALISIIIIIINLIYLLINRKKLYNNLAQ